ncbi:MAG: hypothetical protein R2795_23415 [Saprospiraceae bacterium]
MRYGFIAGSICITLFAGLYFMEREWVLSRGLWWGSLLVYILAMWQAQRQESSTDMRELIRPSFLVFVVANALFYLYYHLLFTVFDPEL